MTDPSGSIDVGDLIRELGEGSLPRSFVLHAAGGLLPLAQDDLTALLLILSTNNDVEVRLRARRTIEEIPPRKLAEFASNQRAAARHLELLAGVSADEMVFEAILRNRATPDETVANMAGVVAAPLLQDIIVTNQERILRTPLILDALFANPRLASDVRRRARELKEEFFEKQERLARLREDTPLLEEEASPEGLDLIVDLLEKADKQAQEGASQDAAATLPETTHPDHLPAYNRILKMNIAEKIRCAFKGGKSERAILIRDRSKLVCTAVMRNGRLTEQEIEVFASSRNVDDEVLRIIGMSRSWMSKYPIMLGLVRNPKSPVGVVLPQINRLTLRDLQSLSRDRGVAEVVRKTASKFVSIRAKKA